MFLAYVLAAVRPMLPGKHSETEALLQASQLPSVPVLARYLLNDLNTVDTPFILALDDYHRIQGTAVHDLIAEVLAYPPRGMHLALITRHDPPLPLSRLRGRGQMTEIRAADLRFTAAEAAAFLNRMLKKPVDDATAVLLEEKTEGWVTGLRLAGLYLCDQDDLKQRVQKLRGSSRHIAEYLASEVLSAQHPEIKAYLLETSILERFCAPLCQAVHCKEGNRQNKEQNLDAKHFIEWLVEANIFVIPLDEQGYWYRYHHLFRDFLKHLLRKQTNADTIARLHMEASKWFAESSLIDEAIGHALAAGDTWGAVRQVLDHRYDLMSKAQFHRLNHWLKMLPKETVAETPLLVSAKAFIGIEQGQDTDVYTYTDQADRMLSGLPPKSEEHAVLKGEVHLLKGFIDMAVGRPDTGLAQAEETLSSPSIPAQAWLVRSLGFLTLAACHQMKGNAKQAVKVIREALLDPAWPDNILARMHFYSSIIQYMDANLAGAVTSSRECLQIVQHLPFTHTRTFAEYLLGAALYAQNKSAEAERYLLCVVDDLLLSNPSYSTNAGFILACIYLTRNSAGKAEQILDQVGAYLQENGYSTMIAMAHSFQVELALRQGDVQRAQKLSNHVDFDIRPPLWFFYVPQLTSIKLLLADGTNESLEQAHTGLVELDEQMGRINRKSVRIDVLALLALVCHKSGKEAAALENLKTALDLAEPGGWIRNFVDLGAPMRDLLERLNQADPGHKYAQLVLDECKVEARKNVSAGQMAEKKSDLLVPILSLRETELISLIAEGLSNKEIAERLYIATETVKTHLQNIYGKLSVKGRINAVNEARTLGLII